MKENVPKIRTQIGANEKGQYAAIWVDTEGTAAFEYKPGTSTGDGTTPIYNGNMFCAPPRWINNAQIRNENHLVARIKQFHTNVPDIHPEDILEHQVKLR